MIAGLDHVALAVADPDAAARAWGAVLGQAPGPRAFALENTGLRILGGQTEGAEFAFGLTLAAADAPDALRRLARRGLTADADGRLDPARTHGVSINVAAAAPRPAFAPRADAPHALDHVVIHTPNPERAVALYGGRLGLDLRLDRENPQWGTRLLFFRCGGAVLEIAATLGAPVTDAPDRITGLAFRVADADAAQARLAAAGLDVSQVRQGRKPGTAVFTLRAGAPGLPALMLAGAGQET